MVVQSRLVSHQLGERPVQHIVIVGDSSRPGREGNVDGSAGREKRSQVDTVGRRLDRIRGLVCFKSVVDLERSRGTVVVNPNSSCIATASPNVSNSIWKRLDDSICIDRRDANVIIIFPYE